MPTPALAQIKALTFDCYGTLVDWEHGLLSALRPILERGACHPSNEHILHAFAEAEREVESGAYMPYREVCAEVARLVAHRFAVTLAPGEERALAESIARCPAFAETPGALRELKPRFRLGVLSNIDDDLFALTEPKLGVPLDLLVTAQGVRSYKPGPAHFEAALQRLGLRAGEVLHVAESRYHDVGPARALGFRTAWVNRKGGGYSGGYSRGSSGGNSGGNPGGNPGGTSGGTSGGASASGAGDARPDLTVGSLGELVQAIRAVSVQDERDR